MSLTGRNNPRAPRTPTPPRGEEIAAYGTYLEAQRAVDFLSDQSFPVQLVTIVGRDLQMVERVTGRLTYSRVALAGLASGAWFGTFVGLLLLLFGGSGELGVIVAGMLGAGFGLLFSVISYAFTGGQRDFTSSSQIVASSYAVLCEEEHAARARNLLLNLPGLPAVPGLTGGLTPPPAGGRWVGAARKDSGAEGRRAAAGREPGPEASGGDAGEAADRPGDGPAPTGEGRALPPPQYGVRIEDAERRPE